MTLHSHTISYLITYDENIFWDETIFFNLKTLLDKENELPEFAQLCGSLLGSKWEYVCAGFSLVAVLGVAIVYWILMSNFLRNTLEFGQGILILYTKGTINDVTEKYP